MFTTEEHLLIDKVRRMFRTKFNDVQLELNRRPSQGESINLTVYTDGSSILYYVPAYYLHYYTTNELADVEMLLEFDAINKDIPHELISIETFINAWAELYSNCRVQVVGNKLAVWIDNMVDFYVIDTSIEVIRSRWFGFIDNNNVNPNIDHFIEQEMRYYKILFT